MIQSRLFLLRDNCCVPIRILSVLNIWISVSQIIVCLKKYAKDSRMVYYFRLELYAFFIIIYIIFFFFCTV